MVGIWRYHHRRYCFFFADGGSLYHRHTKNNSTRYFHVQYALCVQVSALFFFWRSFMIRVNSGFSCRWVRWNLPPALTPYSNITHLLHSILYKTKLPFILVFNKTDVQPQDFALEWMSDFEEFQAALASHSGTRDSEGEPTYMNSLMNSMSLVLDEFYKNLKVRPDTACFFFLVRITFDCRLSACQV